LNVRGLKVEKTQLRYTENAEKPPRQTHQLLAFNIQSTRLDRTTFNLQLTEDE